MLLEAREGAGSPATRTGSSAGTAAAELSPVTLTEALIRATRLSRSPGGLDVIHTMGLFVSVFSLFFFSPSQQWPGLCVRVFLNL